jgi:type VI secretion system protein VasG
MVSIDNRRLVGLLNKFCRGSLERAAGYCLTRGNYDITVEHTLMAMTESNTADIQSILRHYEIDPARILRILQRDVESLKTGNTGKPTFHQLLPEWIQDAWLLGSVEYKMTEIRSGILLMAIIASPARYGFGGFIDELEKIPKDDLRKNLLNITAGSSEESSPMGEKDAGKPGERKLPEGDSALARFTINFT